LPLRKPAVIDAQNEFLPGVQWFTEAWDRIIEEALDWVPEGEGRSKEAEEGQS